MGVGVGVVATSASCSVASSERGKAQQASRWLLTHSVGLLLVLTMRSNQTEAKAEQLLAPTSAQTPT